MTSPEPFAVFDCGLVRYAIGRSCSNLRELLEAIRTVPDMVLEHHMMRCALDDHFELYEFPNDLARWCWEALGDRALAEQMGLIDPYRYRDGEQLRGALLEILEGRLWALERIPWCRGGLELHLSESRLLVFDTLQRAHSPEELKDAIERMSLRSLFYHVHAARRRTGGASDDLSAFLRGLPHADSPAAEVVARRIEAVD